MGAPRSELLDLRRDPAAARLKLLAYYEKCNGETKKVAKRLRMGTRTLLRYVKEVGLANPIAERWPKPGRVLQKYDPPLQARAPRRAQAAKPSPKVATKLNGKVAAPTASKVATKPAAKLNGKLPAAAAPKASK